MTQAKQYQLGAIVSGIDTATQRQLNIKIAHEIINILEQATDDGADLSTLMLDVKSLADNIQPDQLRVNIILYAKPEPQA